MYSLSAFFENLPVFTGSKMRTKNLHSGTGSTPSGAVSATSKELDDFVGASASGQNSVSSISVGTTKFGSVGATAKPKIVKVWDIHKSFNSFSKKTALNDRYPAFSRRNTAFNHIFITSDTSTNNDGTDSLIIHKTSQFLQTNAKSALQIIPRTIPMTIPISSIPLSYSCLPIFIATPGTVAPWDETRNLPFMNDACNLCHRRFCIANYGLIGVSVMQFLLGEFVPGFLGRETNSNSICQNEKNAKSKMKSKTTNAKTKIFSPKTNQAA
jgi:hypothetical protein